MSRFASKQHSPTDILSLRLFSQEVGKRKRILSIFISQHVWHFLTNLTPAGSWQLGHGPKVRPGADPGDLSWSSTWDLAQGSGLSIMITHQFPSHLASFGNIHLGYQRGWRYMMSALEVTVAKDQVDATWKQIWRWGCDIRNTWHEMFVLWCHASHLILFTNLFWRILRLTWGSVTALDCLDLLPCLACWGSNEKLQQN